MTKPNPRIPPPRPSERRRQQNTALAAWHREWVRRNLADAPFRPNGRRRGSDYGQHFVDIEADNAEFHKSARVIMGIDSA